MTRLNVLLPVLLMLGTLPSGVLSHQLDEYLQATIVFIEPDEIRLKMNLTPGVAIVGRILPLIDTNRDEVISAKEAEAYAELLKRDLQVRIDQRDVELKRVAISFPSPDEMRGGFGIIQVEFALTAGSLTAGEHKLRIENKHQPAVSAYLVNAAKPASGSIQITRQNRNENQSIAEIEFTSQPTKR